MNQKLLFAIFTTCLYASCSAWDVEVVNNSDASYQVAGCFSEGAATVCDISSPLITVAPNSTATIPLPAGPGSCLNHLFYRKV